MFEQTKTYFTELADWLASEARQNTIEDHGEECIPVSRRHLRFVAQGI